MRNATLRKLVIIGCSVAALAGGAGIDTAYALGGGGFDSGGGGMAHMGGGHLDGVGGSNTLCEFGPDGVGIAHIGEGSPLGLENVGAPAEGARGPHCDYGTDCVTGGPDCRVLYRPK
jgi:hypothetical protein